MKFEPYTDAVLTCDLPEHRLRRGDVVKLVEHQPRPQRGDRELPRAKRVSERRPG